MAMDPVQRNALFTRIAVFLFGLTIYLSLTVVGLMQFRGEMGPGTRSPKGCLTTGVALTFATLCMVIAVLPGSWVPRTPYETNKQAAAPFVLVIMALFCVGFVYLAMQEIVRTVQWLRAGRPRPPAPAPAQRARARRSGRHRGRR